MDRKKIVFACLQPQRKELFKALKQLCLMKGTIAIIDLDSEEMLTSVTMFHDYIAIKNLNQILFHLTAQKEHAQNVTD